MSRIAWGTRWCSSISTTTLRSTQRDIREIRFAARPGRRRVRLRSHLEAGVGDAPGQVVGGVLGDDAAVIQEDDLIADTGHFVHLVAGVDDRQVARIAQRLDQRQRAIGDVRIERGGRLVHQHHLRIVQQGFDQVDAGSLAGGERQESLAHQVVDAEVLAQLADLALRVRRRDTGRRTPPGFPRP